MVKFIMVSDYTDFEKIKELIDNYSFNNYYIAPKLMYSLLESLNYHCVVGLNVDDIKIRAQHDKIDMLTMPVYNKVFERDVYRVDALKFFYLIELKHAKEYTSVVFGTKEDAKDFEHVQFVKLEEFNK